MTTQKSALGDVERSVARVHVVDRAGQVLFSALMVINDRHRFRRPRLQWTLLGAVTAESVWLIARRLRTGTYRDPLVLWVDTAFAGLGLIVCRAGLGDGGGALWMKNMAIGAAHTVSASDRRVERIAATSVLGAAAMWTGARARGRDAHLAGWMLGLNDAVNWTTQEIAARSYVSAHVRHAALAEEASAIAVAHREGNGGRGGAKPPAPSAPRRDRRRIACAPRADDVEAATNVARREAARLRHALRTRGARSTGLDAALQCACEPAGAQGLSIELVTSEVSAEVSRVAQDALRRATETALLAAREVGGAAPRGRAGIG